MSAFKHGIGYENYKYNLWKSIKKKCYLASYVDYHWYGARGISMYEPWIKNFKLFEEQLTEEIGERPEGYTLDRINNDGDYVPGNLRWATRKTQALNRRNRYRNLSLQEK